MWPELIVVQRGAVVDALKLNPPRKQRQATLDDCRLLQTGLAQNTRLCKNGSSPQRYRNTSLPCSGQSKPASCRITHGRLSCLPARSCHGKRFGSRNNAAANADGGGSSLRPLVASQCSDLSGLSVYAELIQSLPARLAPRRAETADRRSHWRRTQSNVPGGGWQATTRGKRRIIGSSAP